RLPFDSRNPASLMAMHSAEPAPTVRSVSRVAPARLAEAVDRCLAKDPAARYPTGEALAEAIADAQLTRREIAPSVREFLGAAKSGAAQVFILGGVVDERGRVRRGRIAICRRGAAGAADVIDAPSTHPPGSGGPRGGA